MLSTFMLESLTYYYGEFYGYNIESNLSLVLLIALLLDSRGGNSGLSCFFIHLVIVG